MKHNDKSIFASSYNAICIGVYVNELREVSQNNGNKRLRDTQGYINLISYNFRKLSSLDIYKDFISAVPNDIGNEMVIDVIFKENNKYDLDREDLLNYLVLVIDRMVKSNYSLSVESESILLNEMLIHNSLKNIPMVKERRLLKI